MKATGNVVILMCLKQQDLNAQLTAPISTEKILDDDWKDDSLTNYLK